MGKASNAKKDRAQKIAESGYNKKPFNWFPVIISSIAVVLVAGLGALAIFGNERALEPTVAPTSNVTLPSDITTIINQDDGGISVGESSNVLEEYLDYGCPYCGTFNETYGESIKEYVANGDLTLTLHPLALLDNAFRGSEFSTRAANSLYCVAETAPNSVLTYSDNLFANQPREGGSGLTDDQLVRIAETSGAAAAESCIRSVTYRDFVALQTRSVRGNDWFRGTPTLRLNGEIVQANDILGALEQL